MYEPFVRSQAIIVRCNMTEMGHFRRFFGTMRLHPCKLHCAAAKRGVLGK